MPEDIAAAKRACIMYVFNHLGIINERVEQKPVTTTPASSERQQIVHGRAALIACVKYEDKTMVKRRASMLKRQAAKNQGYRRIDNSRGCTNHSRGSKCMAYNTMPVDDEVDGSQSTSYGSPDWDSVFDSDWDSVFDSDWDADAECYRSCDVYREYMRDRDEYNTYHDYSEAYGNDYDD
jgi:hypothetical protein